MTQEKQARDESKRGPANEVNRKPDPDQRSSEAPAEMTNQVHASAPGVLSSAPGVGVVKSDADISSRQGGPGHDAPGARAVAPGAQRVGTTEGRAAASARGGAGTSGLERIEAPSAQGQTAFAPATDDTGAPSPGSSGIRATSDPNFTAQRADEEGIPSAEALAEQKASLDEKQQQKHTS